MHFKNVKLISKVLQHNETLMQAIDFFDISTIMLSIYSQKKILSNIFCTIIISSVSDCYINSPIHYISAIFHTEIKPCKKFKLQQDFIVMNLYLSVLK